ncbi:MAG: endonuclease/exonuclease/phosphatase family protein [Spirochaetaceae bacterium]|nr:endonuclease/exonuclease/phosphatase family protein [Spirochaetaceae bacterium]
MNRHSSEASRNHLLLAALVIATALSFSSCSSPGFSDEESGSLADFDIVSLNIHYLVPNGDKTGWSDRRFALSAALTELDPDIIAFQEMETFERGHFSSRNIQLDWVMSTVGGYEVGAYGRPELFPITQPILYKADRFTLSDQGFFFFSDEPDTPYSRPWRGNWPAFATWVLLEDVETEQAVYVFNIHLDAFSRGNRTRGAALIQDRVDSRRDYNTPAIVVGDFNAMRRSRIMSILADEQLSPVRLKGSSYHFGKGINLYGSIDHVLHTSALTPVEAVVVQKKWKGEWPSDHYPVFTSFRWR